MRTDLVIIDHWSTRNPRTRKTPRLKSIISSPLILMIKIVASLTKLWVIFLTRIFIWIEEAKKANSSILRQPIIMLMSLKKTKNKTIKTLATSNVMPATRNVTTPANAQKKAKKLLLTLAISASITDVSKKINLKIEKESELHGSHISTTLSSLMSSLLRCLLTQVTR